MLGQGCCLMLMYRWKGFERANAYALRAQGFHGALLHLTQQAWNTKNVEKAFQEQADGVELSFSARQSLKSKSVSEFLQEHAGTPAVFMEAFLATHPLQLVLNHICKVETTIQTVADCIDVCDPLKLREAELEASSLNMRFLLRQRVMVF